MTLGRNIPKLQYLYVNKVTRARSVLLSLGISNTAAVKDFYSFSWGAFITPWIRNLLCAGMRILKFEPALLSETLVLVPPTPSIGVLIAAVLHKLPIEVVPQCFFSRVYTAVTLDEMTVSSHSLCSTAIPLLTSLLPDPAISRSLSLPLISLFCICGDE